MDRFDLAITGGTLVSATGRVTADLGVRDGRIAAIVAPGTPLDAERTLDASGKHVLPGVIDVHSHHREPGFTHKEDIVTATSASAAGGVTTSFAMPNVQPPPNTAERLASMIELYESRSLIDWNINPAGTVPEETPAMATMGVAAFKVFMVVDTGRDYPHMPGIGVHHHGKLLEIFEAIAPTGKRLMVHPHDQELMDHIEHQYWNRGERDFRAYAKAYSAYDGLIWDTAAALLLRLQRAVGTPLHLLHTQTQGVIEQLRTAKDRGQDVSAELNPWAVFLGNDWANIERLGSYALSYYVPEHNTEPLWEALRDGTIDLVSTDHAPHTREEKEPGWTDGWKAHTGTPSAQVYVPLLLDAVNAGRLSLERVVELTSTAPARVFGPGAKGRLEVGADADVAIVDLDRTWEIRDEDVLSRIDWTPYAGRTVQGAVDTTVVRGRVVVEHGRVVGQPGWGRQARPGRHRRARRTHRTGDTMTRYGLLIPHFGEDADQDLLVEGVRLAERLGFDSIWVRDHLVFHPHGMEGTDRTFIEPFVALTYLAGVTESIGLGAATIIPFRHPLLMAYSVASMSWMTRRRFDLGIGAGNFQHEFDVIGQGDLKRPELMKEQTLIARRLWAGETLEWHSELYDFEDVDLKPQPLHPVPVWWGGATPASARLAVDFCEGWLPGRITFPTYEARVAKIREMTAEQGKPMIMTGAVPVTSIDTSFEAATGRMNVPGLIKNANAQKFWLRPESGEFTTIEELDGSILAGSPDDIVRGVQRYQEIGCDLLIFDFRMRFPDWLEQIEILARDVLPRVGAPVPATT